MKLSPLSTLRLLVFSPSPPKQDIMGGGFAHRLNEVVFGVLVLVIFILLNFPFFLANRAYSSIEDMEVSWFDTAKISQVKILFSSASKIASDSRTQEYLAGQIQSSIKTPSGKVDFSQESITEALSSKISQVNIDPVVALGSSGRVYMKAQELLIAPMSAGLLSEGFVISQTPCSECLLLSWDEEFGWVYENHQDIGAERALEVLEKFRSAAIVGNAVDLDYKPAPDLVLDPKTLSQDARLVMRKSLDALIHLSMLLIAWTMLWVAGTVGYTWDREKVLGYLEPYVLSTHPPWVLYVSRILRACRAIFVCFLVLGLLALLWSIPISWNIFFSLLLLIPIGAFMVGLWGVLAAALFKHAYGRMFARIALSPVMILIVWGVRLGVVWAAIQASDPLRASEMANEFMISGHIPILSLALVMACVSFTLILLINLRIGVLRQGLGAPR